MLLELTSDESFRLSRDRCVYALRDNVVYLVEYKPAPSKELMVTVINAPVKVLLKTTYQTKMCDGKNT